MTGATSTRRLRVQPLAMLPLLRSASLRTGFAAGVVDDVKLPWAVRVGVREGGEGGGRGWRGRGRGEGVDCAGGIVIGGPDGAGEDLVESGSELAAASSNVRVTLLSTVLPLLPPASDIRSRVCPAGPASRMSRSSGRDSVMPDSVTVALIRTPLTPLTVMVDGYGVAAVEPAAAVSSVMVIAAEFVIVTVWPEKAVCARSRAAKSAAATKSGRVALRGTTELSPNEVAQLIVSVDAGCGRLQ